MQRAAPNTIHAKSHLFAFMFSNPFFHHTARHKVRSITMWHLEYLEYAYPTINSYVLNICTLPSFRTYSYFFPFTNFFASMIFYFETSTSTPPYCCIATCLIFFARGVLLRPCTAKETIFVQHPRERAIFSLVPIASPATITLFSLIFLHFKN
ncbi:hypothetical protein TFKS16_0080 [Tannerella forsythia KS16]|nr:hypothetical protein TFKS16_0080 [Tannerella forsythia KS16]